MTKSNPVIMYRVKEVRIAELQARLSEYLRIVRPDSPGARTGRVEDSNAGPRKSSAESRPPAEAPEGEPGHRRAPPRRAPGSSVIAYVDASVLLRLALGQPDSLAEWPTIQRGVSSALVKAESLRTLERLRLRAKLPDAVQRGGRIRGFGSRDRGSRDKKALTLAVPSSSYRHRPWCDTERRSAAAG